MSAREGIGFSIHSGEIHMEGGILKSIVMLCCRNGDLPVEQVYERFCELRIILPDDYRLFHLDLLNH